MEYKYPGDSPRLQHSRYWRYWDLSEERILQKLDQFFTRFKDGLLVDFGCGDGRLSFRYAATFKAVHAVDGDQCKISECKQAAIDLGLHRVNFYNAHLPHSPLPTKNSDVVLCHHLLEHIPTWNVQPILATCNRTLKDDGFLVLSTAHSKADHNLFTLMNTLDGSIEDADEIQFNRAAIHGFKTKQLATQKFSIQWLEQTIKEYGFEIVEIHIYHEMLLGSTVGNWLSHEEIINRFANKTAFLKRLWKRLISFLGNDVLIIARKVRHIEHPPRIFDDQQKIVTTSLCVLPWIHLYVPSSGFAQICCMSGAGETFPTTLGDIREHSLSDLFHSEHLNLIRYEMLQGIWPPECNACKNRESHGNTSLRKTYNMEYKKYFDRILSPEGYEPTIKTLDLRASNICNFKCRSCCAWSSSAWFDEHNLIYSQIKIEKKNPKY